MQKLGYLATVLLLTAVIVGPIGLSYAQTANTAADAKAAGDESRAKFDQMRADRLEMQKQRAAEIREKMMAKKMSSAQDLEAMIAARAEALKKADLTTTADYMTKLKAQAKAAIEARKAAGGPSESQTALEQEREAFAMKVKAHKESLPTAPEKDLKVTVDAGHKVPKTQKDIGATDQKAKEEATKAQADKAAAIKEKKYGQIHYNRK